MKSLKRRLAGIPEVHEGRRGVTAEVERVNSYLVANNLIEVGHGGVAQHAAKQIGATYATVHYSPGGIRRRSNYRTSLVTDREQLRCAMNEASELGLRYSSGGIVWRSAGRGRRGQYRFSVRSKRWICFRVWRLGRDKIWYAARQRHGKWATQLRWEHNVCTLVQLYAGARSRRVVDRCVWATQNRWRAIRKLIVQLYSRGSNSRMYTMRGSYLRRVCPVGLSVVTDGEQLAYREDSTGELFHFARYEQTRHPAANALASFARRAELLQETELRKLVERGEADNIYICRHDSLTAGNCPVGTDDYISRHTLDPTKHYRAGEIRELANGDARFVRAAILAGLRRHKAELRRGYSLLADHV